MSAAFWIIVVVLAMFLISVMTAAFREDKTKGL